MTRPKIVRTPIFVCPFCETYTNRGGGGKVQLDRHVQANHPNDIPMYQSMNIDDIRYYEGEETAVKTGGGKPTILEVPQQTGPPDLVKQSVVDQPETKNAGSENMGNVTKPEVQLKEVQAQTEPTIIPVSLRIQPQYEQQQPTTQQQVPTDGGTSHIPVWNEGDPIAWFESFMRYYKLKPLFIQVQADNARLTNQLPSASTFGGDMKSMDSGITSTQTISYIAHAYEVKLHEFLNRQKEATSIQRTGYSINPQGNPYQERYPIQTPQYPFQQPTPQDQWREQYYQRMEQNMQKLQDAQAMRDAEDRRRLEAQNNELNQRILAMQQTTKNPETEILLRQELKMMQEKFDRIQQDAQRDRDLRQAKELEDIKNNQLNPDWVKQVIQDSIMREHDRVTAKDIDQKIREAVQASTGGISKETVELKKAENEYMIKKDEIETSKERAGMYMDGLKEIAGSISSSLGQALSKGGIPGTQPPAPTTMQISCPTCAEQLMFPNGITMGVCPRCGSKIEVNENGIASIVQPTPPVTPQRPQSQPVTTPRNIQRTTPPAAPPPAPPAATQEGIPEPPPDDIDDEETDNDLQQ